MVMVYELMENVEKGNNITHSHTDDRVVVSFTLACECCYFSENYLPEGHEMSNPGNYGSEEGITSKRGDMFGYTDIY